MALFRMADLDSGVILHESVRQSLWRRGERWTHMSIGQGNGFHQVHALSVHLDEGEYVAGFDRVAKRMQLGRSVWTLLPRKPPLCVLGCDEVLPCLPEMPGRKRV